MRAHAHTRPLLLRAEGKVQLSYVYVVRRNKSIGIKKKTYSSCTTEDRPNERQTNERTDKQLCTILVRNTIEAYDGQTEQDRTEQGRSADRDLRRSHSFKPLNKVATFFLVAT